MAHHVFHFFSSFEGTAVNAETINFSRGSAEITITNDHASDPLFFKFDVAEGYATVYSSESMTVKMESQSIIVDALGQSVPYRIWVFT